MSATLVMAFGTVLASSLLHSGILANVMRSAMTFFDVTPLGRILNRFSKDIDTIDVLLPMNLRSLLICLFSVDI